MAGSLYKKITKNNAYLYDSGYLHPNTKFEGKAVIGRNVTIENDVIIGDGCFIGHNAVIRPGCVLGDYSELRVNAWMAEKVQVGHHSVIYNYANLAMGTIVGNYVYFGVFSMTTNADDIVLHRDRPFVCNAPIILDGARIASRVTILPGKRIGRNCLIGANSLITKDVPDYEIWFGSPAEKRGIVGKHDVPKAWKS